MQLENTTYALKNGEVDKNSAVTFRAKKMRHKRKSSHFKNILQLRRKFKNTQCLVHGAVIGLILQIWYSSKATMSEQNMTWQVFQSDILVLFSYFLANRNATILKRMKWQFQICFAMSSILCVSEQNIGDINRFLTFIVSPFWLRWNTFCSYITSSVLAG